MDTHLIIHVRQIRTDGLRLQGQLDPAVIFEGCEFHPSGAVEYDLEATLLGEELLVRGRLQAPGTMACVRCLLEMPSTLSVPEFTALREVKSDDSVDLTDAVREDILLVLPAYNKCELDAEFRCPITGESWRGLVNDTPPAPLVDQWSELDKLKLKKD